MVFFAHRNQSKTDQTPWSLFTHTRRNLAENRKI